MVIHVIGCGPTPLTPDPVGPTDGWQVFQPLPAGYDLEDAWAASPASIWAVGAHGVIVHWDGAAVRRVDSPTTVGLTALAGRSRDDIYAAGDEILLHFDGRNWSVARRFPDEAPLDLLCRSDGSLIVVGTMGALVLADGIWRPLARLDDVCSVVWEAPDGRVRIASRNQIWRLDDDGPVVELTVADADFAMAAGRFACGSRSDTEHDVYMLGQDGQWTFLRTVGGRFRALADIGTLVVADNGGIDELVDDGWRTLWSNLHGRWIDELVALDGGGLLACGYGGTLMAGRREGAGFVWNESAQTIGYRSFNDLDGTGCADIWAAEWYDRVLQFDGTTWRRFYTPLPGDSPVEQIQAMGDSVVFALGGGIMVRRDDRGGWSRLAATPSGIATFHAVTPDSLFAATNGRQFMLWSHGAWQPLNQVGQSIHALTAAADGMVYALVGGSLARLLVAGPEGFTAAVELPGLSGTCLHGSRTNDALYIGGWNQAMLDRGIIYCYRDGRLEDLTAGIDLPGEVHDLTEPRPGLLYVVAGGQVWRWAEGVWSREAGLPADEYITAIWSHPDCGVFAHGHVTFFKPLELE